MTNQPHLSTIQQHSVTFIGERGLWAEVIRQAFYRASVGEQSAVVFFRTTGGQFSQLCHFLDLPEDLIREQVNKQAIAALNLKLDREDNAHGKQHLDNSFEQDAGGRLKHDES